MNNKLVKKIVIVGGGSAAWLMACRLASRYKVNSSNVSITVVESPEVSTIGVGEGTWPTMRSTLKKIGISESEFVRICNVSFKQGTCFRRWRNKDKSDRYYHPFEMPQWHDDTYLSDDWQRIAMQNDLAFDAAVSVQPSVCDLHLAPKNIHNAEYQGVLNYGYHLDASALSNMLKEHATRNLGVQHIVDHVDVVHTDEQGWISHLMAKKTGKIDGDFYFDCTGFTSLLVNKTLGVEYVDLQNQLFVDRALAVQVPYQQGGDPIASATLSTAHAAGWLWDIGLRNRRGVGCVYSSSHMTEDEAHAELASYLGSSSEASQIRSLSFQARHLKKFWQKNAVAVGLSSGFVEPLEASALVMVELTADWFCEHFPVDFNAIEPIAKRYNQVFTNHWQSIIDFLKLHYVLSARTEPFWVDNRQKNTISESLQERLDFWQYCSPSSADLDSQSSIFSWQSYLYIFNGMKNNLYRETYERTDYQSKAVKLHIETQKKLSLKASKVLPDNRSFIEVLQNIDMAKL